MNDSAPQFDSARRVTGLLDCAGYQRHDFSFSFDDVVRGLQLLDGDENSGLQFVIGLPVSDTEGDGVVCANWKHADVPPIRMTGDWFCVGGGPGGYICHISTESGSVWLTSHAGDPNELFEVTYDCGCDTNIGVFPGNFVVSFDEVKEAAAYFLQTGKLSDNYRWVSERDMGFDPWYID